MASILLSSESAESISSKSAEISSSDTNSEQPLKVALGILHAPPATHPSPSISVTSHLELGQESPTDSSLELESSPSPNSDSSLATKNSPTASDNSDAVSSVSSSGSAASEVALATFNYPTSPCSSQMNLSSALSTTSISSLDSHSPTISVDLSPSPHSMPNLNAASAPAVFANMVAILEEDAIDVESTVHHEKNTSVSHSHKHIAPPRVAKPFNASYLKNLAVSQAVLVSYALLNHLLFKEPKLLSKRKNAEESFALNYSAFYALLKSFKGNWRDVDSYKEQCAALLALPGGALAVDVLLNTLFNASFEASFEDLRTLLLSSMVAMSLFAKMGAYHFAGKTTHRVDEHQNPYRLENVTKLKLKDKAINTLCCAGTGLGFAITSRLSDRKSFLSTAVSIASEGIFVRFMKAASKSETDQSKKFLAVGLNVVLIAAASGVAGAIFPNDALSSDWLDRYLGPATGYGATAGAYALWRTAGTKNKTLCHHRKQGNQLVDLEHHHRKPHYKKVLMQMTAIKAGGLVLFHLPFFRSLDSSRLITVAVKDAEYAALRDVDRHSHGFFQKALPHVINLTLTAGLEASVLYAAGEPIEFGKMANTLTTIINTAAYGFKNLRKWLIGS